MKANKHDIERMVGALMAATHTMERARRKGDASRLMTLYAIGEVPGRSPKAISEALGIHASSVTRQIQVLEEDGYAKVSADPQDGRSCRVTLTAAGRAEIARLHEVGIQRFASFVATWDAAEVRQLTRLLVKLEASKAKVNAAAQPVRTGWREKK
jgi:DNA-binding MarR family transcriptional regulator